jgi:hypothetical protein
VIERSFGKEALQLEWGNIQTPFGSRFLVSPNPRPRDKLSHYVPYAIDGERIGQAFTPHAERPAGQIYVMGRETGYRVRKPLAWTLDDLRGLTSVTGGDLILGMSEEESVEGTEALRQSGLTNLGKLGRPAFYHTLSRSSVLLGLGAHPAVSPTPYEALYLGIPVSSLEVGRSLALTTHSSSTQ